MVFKNNFVAILGLGISGLAAYNFFKNKGFNVVAWDDNIEICKKHIKLH